MATYPDLYALLGSDLSGLKARILVALAIKANAIANDTNAPAEAKNWARLTLGDLAAYYTHVLHYIVAEYNGQPVSAITNATDAQVQTAVNAAVNSLLGA